MLDIYNHISAFIIFFGLCFVQGLMDHVGARELFFGSLFCAIIIMIPSEIIAWAMYFSNQYCASN